MGSKPLLNILVGSRFIDGFIFNGVIIRSNPRVNRKLNLMLGGSVRYRLNY